MKVLVVGGGAREHAMVEAVRRSGATVYAVMKNKNPGIVRAAEAVEIAPGTDAERVVAAADKWGVDLAVIGPEAPLANGVGDALEAAGVPTASPSRAAARIETDKAFMRDLLEEYGVAGRLRYRVFDSADGLREFIDELGSVAVKPVGLTGGKGVKVTGDHLEDTDAAVAYAREILEQSIGGEPRVIIEEKAVGEEFTLMAFTDGDAVVPMPAIQDHKRAYEGDEGPNTGGMGAYSDADGLLPFLSAEERDQAASIVREIVQALAHAGCPYKGAIYGQFMLTTGGPRVIEVNARFGDPEAMNALTLLESDYTDILRGIAEGDLAGVDVRFSDKATVCKYVVPNGYGSDPAEGERLVVDEDAAREAGAVLYWASVNEEGREGGVVRATTTTSRSLGVTAAADTIADAEAVVEEALESVEGGDLFVRHDIGKEALVQRRVDHMRELRGA